MLRERVELLAREIARAYHGKLKETELELERLPPCRFEVAGKYGDRALTFHVFDGGCVVEGATSRKTVDNYAWHRFARVDRPIKGVLPESAVPVFHSQWYNGGEPTPPPRLDQLVDSIRKFWRDEASRAALLDLRLRSNESLALFPHPMFGDGRPHFYLVHHSPNLVELSRRLDVLKTLYPAIDKDAEVAKRVSDRAYRIKIGAARQLNESVHRFGGSLDAMPVCPNCRTAIHLILTIDTSDKTLELPSLGRREMPIVYCLNCMSWDPLFVDFSSDPLRLVSQAQAEKVNDDSTLEERPVSLVPLGSPNTSVSKVGGAPKWLQGPAIPDCARCDKPMTFFAQLESLRDLSFGDEGVLYAFVCPACMVSATFVQSH